LLKVSCSHVLLGNFEVLEMLHTMLKRGHFGPDLHDQLIAFLSNSVYAALVLKFWVWIHSWYPCLGWHFWDTHTHMHSAPWGNQWRVLRSSVVQCAALSPLCFKAGETKPSHNSPRFGI